MSILNIQYYLIQDQIFEEKQFLDKSVSSVIYLLGYLSNGYCYISHFQQGQGPAEEHGEDTMKNLRSSFAGLFGSDLK